jgi:hypothetical protein
MDDWTVLLAALATLAGALGAWGWERMQLRREWERDLLAEIRPRPPELMHWVSVHPASDAAPAPAPDPADTRALPPLPDEVTRALTEDE